jgi:NTE family protein
LAGGSSAGALVAGLWAAGVSAGQMRERLFSLERADFWDPDPLFALRGGLLRGERFQALLEEALPVRHFHECRIPVRVVAYDLFARRVEALGSGELAPAIRASCSVPGMFQPTVIARRRYIDGGVADRAGIAAASPHSRVLYHHLPAKSPWRRLTPLMNRPPARDNIHVLCEPSLPRLSPFHLHRGPQAYAMAREMALRTLCP